jgi:hypothetical protein
MSFSFFVECFQHPSMLRDNCQEKTTIVLVAVTKRYEVYDYDHPKPV